MGFWAPAVAARPPCYPASLGFNVSTVEMCGSWVEIPAAKAPGFPGPESVTCRRRSLSSANSQGAMRSTTSAESMASTTTKSVGQRFGEGAGGPNNRNFFAIFCRDEAEVLLGIAPVTSGESAGEEYERWSAEEGVFRRRFDSQSGTLDPGRAHCRSGSNFERKASRFCFLLS